MVTLAVPGPRVVRGADPPHWSPHHHKTPYGPGLWNGTAAPYTHTQGHLVTTTLKLRVGKRKEEKDFQCLLLGTPGHRWGRLALKESSMGAGGYRMGTSTEIMYKGEGAPIQPPTGLNWLMGVGCM